MNIFEVLKDAFVPYVDGEKKPLHVGEVMNLWFFAAQLEEAVRLAQIAQNVTSDNLLKQKLNELVETVQKPIIKEIDEFLKAESVPYPTSTPERPTGRDGSLIPDWGKMADEEIANLFSMKLVLGLQTITRGLTESVRADVGAMFARYFVSKSAFAITYRALLTSKGWLKIPPYYKP